MAISRTLMLLALVALCSSARRHHHARRHADLDAEEEGQRLDRIGAPERDEESESSMKRLIEKGFKDWETYKTVHAKQFADQDVENERMLAFLMAKQHVRVHNDAFARGKTSFRIGLNHIADLVSVA